MIGTRPIATQPIAAPQFAAGGGASYTLTVDVGSITLTGQTITLRVARQLSITPAAVAFTGQTVDLRIGGPLFIQPGTITLTGQTIALRYSGEVIETPAPTQIPVASGGGRGGATYDNDFSSFPKRKKKRKKVDTDGPPVTEPAPVLAKGPPRSTKDIVAALLKAPSQVEGPKVLEVVRPDDDDDDEEVLELLLSAL